MPAVRLVHDVSSPVALSNVSLISALSMLTVAACTASIAGPACPRCTLRSLSDTDGLTDDAAGFTVSVTNPSPGTGGRQTRL